MVYAIPEDFNLLYAHFILVMFHILSPACPYICLFVHPLIIVGILSKYRLELNDIVWTFCIKSAVCLSVFCDCDLFLP